MCKPSLIIGPLFAIAMPVIASCQGEAGAKSSQPVVSAPAIHRLSDRMIFIDHGDTVTMIRVRANSQTADTVVYVFSGDTAVRIRPTVGKLSAIGAGRLRTLRDHLRDIDKMNAEVGKLSR